MPYVSRTVVSQAKQLIRRGGIALNQQGGSGQWLSLLLDTCPITDKEMVYNSYRELSELPLTFVDRSTFMEAVSRAGDSIEGVSLQTALDRYFGRALPTSMKRLIQIAVILDKLDVTMVD